MRVEKGRWPRLVSKPLCVMCPPSTRRLGDKAPPPKEATSENLLIGITLVR